MTPWTNEGFKRSPAMTPVEQGQEEWSAFIIRCDGCGRVFASSPTKHECPGILRSVEVVPAAELEMCQRYFPFLRRSRDEAVKDRDKWQRVADGNERGWTAAETARDEAVKREKRMVDELARLRGILREEENRRCGVQEREKALAAALKQIAYWDRSTPTPRELARAALDQSGKGARP